LAGCWRIDTLGASIQVRDEKIEMMLTPHARVVELLGTIPGRGAPHRPGC
jgi:hypothetical protein